MRVAVLHTRLSGYLAACLREFKQRSGTELLIYAWPNQADAPFDASLFADLGEIRNRREHSDAEIEAAARAFQPDVILTSGWVDKGYVRICQVLRKEGIPVIAGCDTQWTGSLRQHLASWIAPWHVQKAIDVLWVTGERQAVLARALGYEGDRLWDGYYACDWERFAAVGRDRGRVGLPGRPIYPQRDEDETKEESGTARRSVPTCLGGVAAEMGQPGGPSLPSFLYVGRYVPEKGLDTLVAAYTKYRQQVAEPWALRCAGAGPLRDTLIAAGAEDLGFVQPEDLPTLMHSASAFILPSRFEPWGVVVQEAAACGLPLILSDACGAGVHLLRHLYNGYRFPGGSVDGLTSAMLAMHGTSQEERMCQGQGSYELSKQYTPTLWAERLHSGLSTLIQQP